MGKKISNVKGMHDILPDQTIYWNIIEKIWTDTIQSYCYDEIRTPIVEKMDLFFSSIGEHTDIVSKELFNFPDRNKDQLALRPEGTVSCIRSAIDNNLLYNKTQRFWYK